ncbi:MAG TPA: hypothetical protein VGF48_11920 [Thermoanaerobaculia bacterium]|jgi:hypothetical protein
MLNIAGPEYDFGNVVFVVLEECEHRRRSFEDEEFAAQAGQLFREKLSRIKAAYDEFGGSPVYWSALEKEVLETVLPQYVESGREMTRLERNAFGVWRSGDPASRGAFALGGLLLGGFIKALPFIPTIENLFVFALAGAGALYPEIKRYTHERRHARALNRLVTDSARYQQNARLHYMTTKDIRESFSVGEPAALDVGTTSGSREIKE